MLQHRLKNLRQEKGVTQKTTAEAIGITQRNYQRFEADKRANPTCSNLIVLADYFGVSIDYLVGRTDNPGIPP
jgi:transcriptional regulator with XRE-family HTH domain